MSKQTKRYTKEGKISLQCENEDTPKMNQKNKVFTVDGEATKVRHTMYSTNGIPLLSIAD